MIATEDLVDWVKAEVEDTVLLRRLEQAAVEAVQLGLGFYIGPVAQITEVLRFKGWPLTLTSDPIGAITTLEHWDGSAWAVVDASSVYVVGGMVFGEGAYYPDRMSRFRVTYTAGYPPHETDPDVWFAPDDVQQLVRLLVAHWYENREAVGVATTAIQIPLGVEMLMRQRARVTF